MSRPVRRTTWRRRRSTAVGSDTSRRADLLRQVVAAFSERWIVWSMPVRVTRNGVERQMTVELRTWHGWEDGSPGNVFDPAQGAIAVTP